MPAAPTGTVTLLFSDIEGSTRLLQRAGESYAELLLKHRKLMRQAFADHDGFEVGTEGDSFFVTFASAQSAAAAALQAQAALGAQHWPEAQEIRVRIGLHTGSPRYLEGNYIGLDVHHAARVMSAGHGGQILLTKATRDQLGGQLATRDLGNHRLKDLAGPQRLFQLGEGTFPSLNTMHKSNLPVPQSRRSRGRALPLALTET